MSNPAFPPKLLQKVYNFYNSSTNDYGLNATAIACNPSIRKNFFDSIIRKIATDGYNSKELDMHMLIQSSNIAIETLENMFKFMPLEYYRDIIENPNCTPELIKRVYNVLKKDEIYSGTHKYYGLVGDFEDIWNSTSKNPNTPTPILDDVYVELLKGKNHFAWLCEMDSDKTIEHIANNSNASDTLLNRIINIETNKVRSTSISNQLSNKYTNLKSLFNATENLNRRNVRANGITFGDNKYRLEIVRKGSREVSESYGKFDDSYSFILPIDYVATMGKNTNVDTLLSKISNSQIKNKRANSILSTITGLNGAFLSDNYEDLIGEMRKVDLDYIIENQPQIIKPDSNRYYDEDMDIMKTLEEVKKRMDIEESKGTELSPDKTDSNDILIKYEDRIALEKKQAEETRNRKNAIEDLKKKREAAAYALNELSEAEQKVTTKAPITRKNLDLSNFLLKEGDHFVINPVYIKYGLENINLCTLDFTNVDVKGIDFRDTNAVFDPKKVYNKDIRGTKFSTDNTLLFGFGYDKLLDGTKYDSQTHVEDPFDCLDDEPRVMQ